VVNVLFTSAGRRVELVRAFRNAEAALGLGGNVVTVDMNPLAPALQEADKHYVVPRLDAPGYIDSLVGICRTERIGLVFPTIDPDIQVLADHRGEIEEVGARVLSVSRDAATVTGDKWLTYEMLNKLGVPAPKSWRADEALAADIAFPAFIKPRAGSASQFTFRVENRRQLEFFLDYVPLPIVQELLPGPEITNDVICGEAGKVLAVVSRERIEVRWGEVQKGRTILDAEIALHCEAIAGELGAIGPITVQCMMKNGKPYFTEINCRYGGGSPLGIAAGADSPAWYLALAAGLEPHISTPAYREGIYISRFDDALFFDEEHLAEISRDSL
jgi:carbamoyl-phosphate synthase large subunit